MISASSLLDLLLDASPDNPFLGGLLLHFLLVVLRFRLWPFYPGTWNLLPT